MKQRLAILPQCTLVELSWRNRLIWSPRRNRRKDVLWFLFPNPQPLQLRVPRNMPNDSKTRLNVSTEKQGGRGNTIGDAAMVDHFAVGICPSFIDVHGLEMGRL